MRGIVLNKTIERRIRILRKVTVPEDTVSEQKVVLGIVSMRQLIYLVAAFAILSSYIPSLFSYLIKFNFVVGVIVTLVSAMPVLAVIGVLGFLRNKKYQMYYDSYLFTKIGFKSQIGVWSKKAPTPDWMEELK